MLDFEMRSELEELSIVELGLDQWKNELRKVDALHYQQSYGYLNSSGRFTEIRLIGVYRGGEIVGAVAVGIKKWYCFSLKVLNMGPSFTVREPLLSRRAILAISKKITSHLKSRRALVVGRLAWRPSENDLKLMGLREIWKTTRYMTGRIDLRTEEGVLMKNLRSSWRRQLKKSFKLCSVSVQRGMTDCEIGGLMTRYKEHQVRRGYNGIDKSQLMRLCEGFDTQLYYLRGYSKECGSLIGEVVLLAFADTITYLIGIQNKEGRKSQVNTRLFWEAVVHGKYTGYKYMDLGGLDIEGNGDIARFKLGLSPELCESSRIVIGVY